MLSFLSSFQKKQRRPLFDALVVVYIVILGVVLFASLDIYEHLHDLTRTFESDEFDDIFLGGFFAACCGLLWFARRRLVESKAELHQRKALQTKLAEANEVLESRVRERTASLEASNASLKQATSKAQQADQAKSRLLSLVSHEIRNPAQGVLGQLQLLRSDMQGLPQAKRIDMAIAITQGLNNVTDDLLDFSSIESGTLRIRPASFALKELVSVSMETFRPLVQANGLDLTLTMAKDLPTQLIGDASRIRQILYNLLANALKFTHQGGISLDVSVADHGAQSQRIVFTVTDTGLGISASDLEHIFMPFSRARQVEDAKIKGVGLGLWIVKTLVDQMQGTVDVKSTPEQGASISIALPLEEATPVPEPAQPEAEAPDTPCWRILLAEDEVISHMTIRDFLESEGHEVSSAFNGQEAMNLARDNAYDCILLDMMMPHTNGDAVALAIRQGQCGDRNIDVPIISMSAMTTTKGAALLNEHADAVLPKPFTLHLLRQALDDTMGPTAPA